MNTQTRSPQTGKLSLMVLILSMQIPMTVFAARSIAELPDPTRPLGSSTLTVNDFRHGINLQSILHSSKRKSTVINGYIRYVGSHVNGGRIVDIRHDAVVINYHGQLYTLYLNTSNSVSQRGIRQ